MSTRNGIGTIVRWGLLATSVAGGLPSRRGCRMRVRSLGVGAVITLAVLAAGPIPLASSDAGASSSALPDSLRALAAKVRLLVGTAIVPFDLDNPDYSQIAADQFSSVTAENEMKWQVVEPTQGVLDFSGGDRLVQFAQANGQLVRGYTLVWHNQLPTWLTTGVANGTISNDQLRSLLQQHITAEVTHFKGQIWQWDVANEFFADASGSALADGINGNNFWVQHLGEGVVADAFRWARAADQHALLFYSDYNIAGEDGTNAKSDAVFAWVQQMRAAGVPIDGIADEGHLDTQFGFPTQMQQDLQRLADVGLNVAITQADVRTFVTDPTTQQPTDRLAVSAHAHYYDQMLKACLAVRSCISFTVWGFGDADSWIPGFFRGEGYATIYDVNLQPKPAFTDLQQDLQLAKRGALHRPKMPCCIHG
jgi:endo-1,4-beta-xylanase